MSSAGLNTAYNVSQPTSANGNIEAMFQQIMHAVHKSVSGRVVSDCAAFHLDACWISIVKLVN